MRFLPYVLTFVISIIGTSSWAKDARVIDFDQRIYSSEALNRVENDVNEVDATAAIMGVPVLLPHVDLELKRSISPQSATPTILSGGFRNAIIQHPGHFRALQSIPIVRRQPAEISEPLLANWDEIQLTRALLLNDADGLETKRDDIVADGEKLDENAAKLLKKQETLNSDINDFNDQCAGRPRTPFCDRWRADLESRKKALEGEFAMHNAKVEEWRKVVAKFNVEAAKHNGERDSWGEAIKAFSKAVEDKANYEELCHFVKLIDKKCVYKCQGFVNGVVVVELGFWWTKEHGGQCDQFANLDDLIPLDPPRGPEGIIANP